MLFVYSVGVRLLVYSPGVRLFVYSVGDMLSTLQQLGFAYSGGVGFCLLNRK